MNRLNLIVIILACLCMPVCDSSKKIIPDFQLVSYVDGIERRLSTIDSDSTLILWLPLNSCELCVETIMQCLQKNVTDFNGLIVTTDSNPSRYNWMRLKIKDLYYKNYFNYTSRQYGSFKNYNRPQIYIINSHRNILKRRELPDNKMDIVKVLSNFKVELVRHDK